MPPEMRPSLFDRIQRAIHNVTSGSVVLMTMSGRLESGKTMIRANSPTIAAPIDIADYPIQWRSMWSVTLFDRMQQRVPANSCQCTKARKHTGIHLSGLTIRKTRLQAKS